MLDATPGTHFLSMHTLSEPNHIDPLLPEHRKTQGPWMKEADKVLQKSGTGQKDLQKRRIQNRNSGRKDLNERTTENNRCVRSKNGGYWRNRRELGKPK